MNYAANLRADRVVKRVHLRPSDHGRALSLDEFEHASGAGGYRYELIDERVEVSPLPEMPHEELIEWLRVLLADYRRKHPEIVAKVSTASRVHIPNRCDATCPEPDVAVYAEALQNLPLRLRSWRKVNPFIVVEVVSPDTAKKDLERNYKLYLELPSIREYWIVETRPDPGQPRLIVYRRRGERWQKPIVVQFGETSSQSICPDSNCW